MPSCPVSVVIPVRNGAAFIGEALRSVLAQTRVPGQIIVVDDGSSDDTPGVVGGFTGVEYLAQSPRGVSAARNAGAERARHPFLAFLDADDLWRPDKTELQLDHAEGHAETDIVTSQMRNFRRTTDGETVFLTEPVVANQPGTLLMRRETFWRVGPYATGLSRGETLEWWARALDLGLRVHAIPEVLMLRRVHGANTSYDPKNSTQNYLRALRTITTRRRGERPT